jgi:quinol monooxygenase YgiN
MSEQRHVRIDYRVRPDADLDALAGHIRAFVAGLGAHHATTDYTSYRDAKDPRHFVHVGHFDTAVVPTLQGQAFFQTFTKTLREFTVADPEVTNLEVVASTR